MSLFRTAARLHGWPKKRNSIRLNSRRYISDKASGFANSRFFQVSEEVRDAVATGKPVVALETTIYTHGEIDHHGLVEHDSITDQRPGFPYPDNIALASLLESVVRRNGGVPATIGVLNGVARVGLDPEEMIELASAAQASKTVLKVSRRDIGYICGMVS
jgi:pseudouridine-5'-phosphate glycosidase